MNNRFLSLSLVFIFLTGCAGPPAVGAQSAEKLTIEQAQAIAIRNQPRLLASLARAEAAGEATAEARSAYFPQAYGSATGVRSENGSRIAAGGLNNPIIYSRYANGVTVSQLITDFGRTGNLVQSANLRAKSQQENSAATRADILLQVDQAYFGVLRAQTVLKVAQQAVQERQLVVNQVTLLEQNKLKSSLDVSFANVDLEQAKLLLVQAQNGAQAAFANLSLALGYTDQRTYELQDQPLPPTPSSDLSALVAQAMQSRPELASGRYQLDSARAFERAERDLWLPTLSAVGAAGLTPVRAEQLLDRYSAAGFNLSIPIFDGGLFTARHAEARFQADAVSQDLRELQDQIAHDVRVAWLDANTAYQRLSVTQQLQQEAAMALQLAQARYKLGLSSIVELSQAQLNKTQAELDQATAMYQCQIATDTLRYQTGSLR